MHNITHMAKIPSVMPADDMSLRNLFFLFLGLLRIGRLDSRMPLNPYSASPPRSLHSGSDASPSNRSRINFRMHNITHMAKIPSVMPADDMSLRNLFFLFRIGRLDSRMPLNPYSASPPRSLHSGSDASPSNKPSDAQYHPYG
jgi:hypothetical protein